ncbi:MULTISPECIES: PEP-CTERM sorting domain-containing protein [unclassified Microcystis]|jgi:hypothetical protein|uniref:PEP-CTERM sorting domain-containing protein n=1 Tax=Microcystis flos-aquae Mf_QC_C_20070823_S10D TaxID=2486236 RepID=A0A552KMW5_9CHRO|nr:MULTISPECIES: PEP-CTERM sorting domain-containing protein [unclassified Microcystis]MCA2815447.1 PEP-CTERM sorting domain-containing protein [Microcystis sp. M085S1]MCA2856498.1 PEP-CTERM sorting domain-containing protein [Microcystis sp. M065S1]TRT81208.1 MAG: PEP-CTERM sorting domain-containing protein [Microcystis flos-aquae Ma_QC_C_20070823_S18]TRT97021.1 MAG: PEP-CTERM sorting domain-containing protein [Microcystis flos-aquae Ma_QC_C_20070823_S18D]TRV09333.1 MAG: PEP-CTERM sorting doma
MTQKILAKLMSFASSDKLGLFKIAIASSCLMIVPQGQVRAASIFIANHSFEAPIITDPSGILDTGIGTTGNWTFAGASARGFINPGLGENDVPGFWYGPSPTLPNGNQVAWSNGGTISQTLTETLQANTKYTLGVYVGHRQNVAFAGYNIELLAGATVLASNNSITPAAETFAPVTVSYTSGSSGSLLGQALQIRLTSNGEQANFDLITLDASPIPEPSAMLGLLGFGLLGIGSTLKQKR